MMSNSFNEFWILEVIKITPNSLYVQKYTSGHVNILENIDIEAFLVSFSISNEGSLLAHWVMTNPNDSSVNSHNSNSEDSVYTTGKGSRDHVVMLWGVYIEGLEQWADHNDK